MMKNLPTGGIVKEGTISSIEARFIADYEKKCEIARKESEKKLQEAIKRTKGKKDTYGIDKFFEDALQLVSKDTTDFFDEFTNKSKVKLYDLTNMIFLNGTFVRTDPEDIYLPFELNMEQYARWAPSRINYLKSISDLIDCKINEPFEIERSMIYRLSKEKKKRPAIAKKIELRLTSEDEQLRGNLVLVDETSYKSSYEKLDVMKQGQWCMYTVHYGAIEETPLNIVGGESQFHLPNNFYDFLKEKLDI